MNLLEKIAINKKLEVEDRKTLFPVQLLEKSLYFETKAVSMKNYILRNDKSGIIAEFKRKSPSQGFINKLADPAQITLEYMQAGASGLSVLTDNYYFGGNLNDLKDARNENYCPILQKDFIINEYQIIEAKASGADTILLIAAILTKKEIQHFISIAHSLSMEVLLEIHSPEESGKITEEADLLGINNRNLETMKVNVQHSYDLISSFRKNFTCISESGIEDPRTLLELKQAGFDGFLIGTGFMKSRNPGGACKQFIRQYQLLLQQKNKHSKNQSYEQVKN